MEINKNIYFHTIFHNFFIIYLKNIEKYEII
jgi:hypothetical protein